MKFWPWVRSNKVTVKPDPVTPPNHAARWIDALHIVVLNSFGVAQPIYDRLSERASLFIDQRIGISVAYLLVGLFSIGLPAVLILLESVLSRFGKRAYQITHLVMVGLLLLTLALPVAKYENILTQIDAVLVALVLTGIVTGLYYRFQSVRSIVTLASPGIAIFPLIFLTGFAGHLRQIDPIIRKTDKWNPVPVVMLVCDEFCGSSLMTPERQIDAVRFPNFAALANEGTWYRNATSVHPVTEHAVPAILSGRYANTPHKPVPADLPQNLFSVLDATGEYKITLFEPVTTLAPISLEAPQERPQGMLEQSLFLSNCLWKVYLFHLTPMGYQNRLPQVPAVWFGLHEKNLRDTSRHEGVFRYNWGGQRPAQFQHFLNCFEKTSKPTFHFMHILLPHMPWSFTASGRRYSEDGDNWELLSVEGDERDLIGFWGQDELEAIQNQQRHLLQVMYLDRLIGRLVARLKELEIYDRCLLVVTADHGISFRSGESIRGLMPNNRDEILSVPLFIKRPGQTKGGTSDRDVEGVDIFPSIMDELGIEVHDKVDGWPVWDQSKPARTKKTFGDVGANKSIDPAVIRNSRLPQDIRKRFGDAQDPDNFYRVGPIPELIGKAVQGLSINSEQPTAIELSRYGEQFGKLPTDPVPALYEGTIQAGRKESEPIVIAVAINGTIRAVTRTYRRTELTRQWSALVSEASFHPGTNDVQFYTVTKSDSSWQLTRCNKVFAPKMKTFDSTR